MAPWLRDFGAICVTLSTIGEKWGNQGTIGPDIRSAFGASGEIVDRYQSHDF